MQFERVLVTTDVANQQARPLGRSLVWDFDDSVDVGDTLYGVSILRSRCRMFERRIKSLS